jgi:DMSO/TMAO reductase YedYZ molybdopterin-dependent catalytic subunit
MRWPAGLLVSAAATTAALALMFWARAAFQVRTLPERLLEWLLLFIPLEAFEKGVQQFGPNAKEYGLYGAIGVMALLLFSLGLVALGRGWSGWAVLVLGLVLWLFAMAVVMPITGAGFFAQALFQNAWLVNASYLGVALAYATALLLGRLLLQVRPAARVSRTGGARIGPATRRPFLVSLAGLAASYAAVGWFARQGTTATSNLPLATIKPPAASPAAATGPTMMPGVAPGTMAAASGPPPTAQAAPKPAASAPDSLPVPPPPRDLSRDKDGSLTAAGRRPGELAPLITPNESFYIVTKNAGGDPVVQPESWRLIVDGEVNTPVQLDYRTLRQLPAVEQTKTLECISNFTAMCELTSFGCYLISTAKWKGVRLKDVLDLAGGIKGSATVLAVLSTDEFSSAIPIDAAMDPDTMLAYEMNGEVLPYEHGYPARLIVPGRYGMKNAKWVMAVRPMSQQYVDYYGQRNWNQQGIVKTMARIDQPAPGGELAPGSQRIAGIAYAGNRGVTTVQFSVDGGQTWQDASLIEPPAGKDAWVRWQGTFMAAAGAALKLVARTVDGSGTLQPETFSLPQPDGGGGWHSIQVNVRSA